MLPSALCLQLPLQVPAGVLNSKGCCHLSAELQGPSCLVPDVLPRPRSHPNSAPSHTPQKSNPFQFPSLRSCSLGWPLPLCGCTADRRPPPSPTNGAARPPASAPPPPPLSSSGSCSPSSQPRHPLSSVPTPSDRCPVLPAAGCNAPPVPTAIAVTHPPPC